MTYPTNPPATICNNASILDGPPTIPPGAIEVKSGDNGPSGAQSVDWSQKPNKTYYFDTGPHTLGTLQFGQIQAWNGNTYVGAPGAYIDGQGLNQYAFTAYYLDNGGPNDQSDNVTIENLTIENFVPPGQQGAVNQNAGHGWTIRNNTITNNRGTNLYQENNLGGAGVILGPNNTVSYNCLSYNGQYGFSAIYGSGTSQDANVTLDHNEIKNNGTDGYEASNPGCCDGGGKFWQTIGGTVTNNYVHNNLGPGIWLDTNNAGFLIDGNYISNNDQEAIIYEISYNGRITNNNILANGYYEGIHAPPNFPVSAIYISGSGGDSRVDGGLYSAFDVSGNNLVNNWGGISLWEDAGRFCGAEETACTLVNPNVTPSSCVTGTISNQPYLSDCRWKTQNVLVHDNSLSFDKAAVGCDTGQNNCGLQTIIANQVSSPSWSPYLGTAIQTAITTQQNNEYVHNTYTGPWQFSWANGAPITLTQWQGSPYGEDVGSTFGGVAYQPAAPGNLIDADTASLEGSLGYWAPWFSTSVAQSPAHAEAGRNSLGVTLTGTSGWGVQLRTAPTGFPATPGPKTISFWGLSTTSGLDVDMNVNWVSASGQALATSTATISPLTGTWQRKSINVTAPANTASFTVTFKNSTGAPETPGSLVFLDQMYVGPVVGSVNVLDANTATLEGSIGHWVPWVSSTVSQSTAQAQSGTHSLLVGITAASGWGIELNNWPGFAAGAGAQTVSFWAHAGNGSNLAVSTQAQWRDSSGAVLGTTNLTLPAVTSTWQQAIVTGIAPKGTASVLVTFTSVYSAAAGVAGNSLYLDQIYVGS